MPKTIRPMPLPVAGEREDGRRTTATLSPRERDVLALVAEGCRDREIAARLYVSHHTVANHVKSILGKLGVSSRAAAVARAARSGLL
jgi:DNA-binding CsgD family transcriptional regulator